MNMTTPSECSGYKVFLLKFTEDSETVHHVFMKEHSVREKCPEKPVDRTLFILGTPPFVTQVGYKNAFEPFGAVENVFFQPSPNPVSPDTNDSEFFKDHPEIKGFKVAYVVFKKNTGLRKVLTSSLNQLILCSENKPIQSGVNKWCTEYNDKFVNTENLQAEINSYMEKFDKDVAEQEAKEKKEIEPDEDGWIKVTKKGRHPGFARKENVHNKIMKKEDQKKKKKQLLNFYRFQIRQSKMDHLVQLREKFEEDKKKIEIMKQNRKFKPF